MINWDYVDRDQAIARVMELEKELEETVDYASYSLVREGLVELAQAVIGKDGEFDDAADWKDARPRLCDLARRVLERRG